MTTQTVTAIRVYQVHIPTIQSSLDIFLRSPSVYVSLVICRTNKQTTNITTLHFISYLFRRNNYYTFIVVI